MIYLDHAATSFHKPKQVAEAVYEALLHTGNGGRGGHGASLDAGRVVYVTRQKIANMFHVGDASHVIFTQNATESLNQSIQGLLKSGDHCITTNMEHNSVLRPLYKMSTLGVEITYVEADEKGYAGVEAIEKAIQPHTKVVVMTHASNVLGSVNEIEAIGNLCKKHEIYFIVDASQTVGLIPIDLQKMYIDCLCFSGHKSLLGPQGVGLLCLGEGIELMPLKVGGTGMDSFSKTMPQTLPEALEAGTLNTHGIAGLHAACSYLEAYGIKRIYEESMALTKHFLEGVREIDGITLYGASTCTERTPVVSLNLRALDAADVADELFERFDIAVRAGAHCAPKVHEQFETEAQGMVRFSFSHFNTIEEVDLAIHALRILEEETR